jgi:hypothetical protein
MQIQITLVKDKETQNKIRFTDPNDTNYGSIYLPKEVAGDVTEIKFSVTLPAPVAVA